MSTSITVNSNGTTRTYTISDPSTDAGIVLTEGAQTVNGAKTLSSALTITPTSNQIVLGTTRTVTLTAPTPATTSRTVTLPDLSASYSIVGTEGSQTVNGTKTFTGNLRSTAPFIVMGTVGASTTLQFNAPATDRVHQISDPGSDSHFILGDGPQGMSGVMTFSNTTDASSSTNASVIMSGGLAVAKLINTGSGIRVPTTGGTASTLSYYEFGTVSMTFTGPIASTGVTASYQRIGAHVTLWLPLITASGNSVGAALTNSTGNLIPTHLRPVTDNVSVFGRRRDAGGGIVSGLAVYRTTGVIDIYATDAAGAFTASTSNHEAHACAVSWFV